MRVQAFLADLAALRQAHPEWAGDRQVTAAGIESLTLPELVEAARLDVRQAPAPPERP